MITKSKRNGYWGFILPPIQAQWQKTNGKKLTPIQAHRLIKLVLKIKSTKEMSEVEYDNFLLKVKQFAFSQFNLQIF